MPTPPMVTAIASTGLLLLGIVTLLWNKLDRRFDAMEKRFDRLDTEIKELRALVQEALKART